MTDVEGKTPTKRKNLSNPQNKKGSAKKAKLDNVNELQKGKFPKQKFNKKNKKNSESENDSPKKLKPFAGTQATGDKIKKVEGIKKEADAEGEKRRRKGLYKNLDLQVRSDKEGALKTIEEKLKIIQSRGELTKTGRRKIKLLERMKRIAEGKPYLGPQKAPHGKSESTKRRDRKRNAKEASKETSIDKNQLTKVVQQANIAKINGKANKNQKGQNKKATQKAVPQKQVEEDEDDSDEDEEEAGSNLEEDESDSENEVNAEQVSGEEEEDDGESGDEEEDEEEEEEADEDEEEESDEDEEEEDAPPPPKVSNKKQKKK